MLSALWNKITDNTNEEEEVDLSQTPWKLHLKYSEHPLDVFLYFATPGEARDQELICVALGWKSLGVAWYN